MGRNSRIRKNIDIVVKRGPKDRTKYIDPFWDRIMREFAKFTFRFPYMNAERPTVGEHAGLWIIFNAADRGDKAGERAFRDLAIPAAKKLGCQGGPEECVHFFISHMMGDHVEVRKEKPVDQKTIDYFTQYGDGTREMHLGRYRQSGVDHSTNPDNKKPVGNMDIPKVVTPTANAEPLIKVVSG